MPNEVWPALPKLKDIQGYPIAEPGKWHYSADPAELHRIAASLDLGEVPPTLAIDRLPDVWARAILNAMVLAAGPPEGDKSAAHPLYFRVRGAWRGFLALLALWHVRGWSVVAHRVDLAGNTPEEDRGQPAPSGAHAGTEGFTRTLHRLLPEAKLADEMPWNPTFVFSMRQLPVGIASPLTLACPNEGVHLLPALAGVPWFRQGRFVDPIEAKALTGSEMARLAGWIAAVRAVLLRYQLDRDLSGVLLGELKSFQDDLSLGPENVSLLPLLEIQHRVFFVLGSPVPRRDDGKPSDVELQRSARHGTDQPAVLVLHRGLPEQWGRTPIELTIGSGLTYASLDHRWELVGSDPAKIGDTQLQRAEWRWSDAFFTPRLALVEGPDAFPIASHASGHDLVAGRHNATPVLPVRSELAEYLGAEDVVSRCTYTADQASVTVTLRLPLRGGECTVTKKYEASDIDRITDVPVVEIWPSFQSADWRVYFTVWDRAESADTLRVEAPKRLIVATSGKINPVREHTASGAVVREITEYGAPPEYLICRRQGDGAEELGILVPKLDPPRTGADGTWSVGIDFGTTNTQVYLRPPGREPQQLDLEVGSVAVARSGDAERRGSLEGFLPGLGLRQGLPALPFLSLFRSRPVRDGAPRVTDPVLSGHILYYRDDGGLIELANQHVSAYLKWDIEPEGRRKVRTYIRQIVLQAAAEVFARGGREIRFAYAYPGAFDRNTQTGFRDTWTMAVDDVRQRTKLAVKPDPTAGDPHPSVERCLESVAAARFFKARQGATPEVGAIVLDIGGGTTDIAVWQGSRVVWSASVRLAGQALLLQPVFVLYRERGRLTSENFRRLFQISPAAEPRFRSDRMVFYRELDAVLKSRGDQCRAELAPLAAQEPIPALLRHVGAGLAGLLYYAGLILRHLVANGAFKRTTPRIFVGGNGSRLLHWADRGTFHPTTSHLRPLFSDVFAGASGLDGDFILEPSATPKAEVAWGLLVEAAELKAHRELEDTVIAGEECTLEGTDAKAEAKADAKAVAVLGVAQITQGVVVSRLPMLEAFVDRFNKHSVGHDRLYEPLALDDAVRLQALQTVQQRLGEQRRLAQDKVELEPPFITALRALLDAQLGA